MAKYLIRLKGKAAVYWSNEGGWVDALDADVFSQEERDSLHLPLGGEWCPLWEENTIQFARLISEAEALGLWNEAATRCLAEEMDLSQEEVCSIISLAQEVFDRMKEKI